MNTLDFLIIGAQKAGTTSLARLLGKCEESVFIPRRELHFWNNPKKSVDPDSISEYFRHFESAKEGQITGEKCPSYMSKEGSADRIAHHLPNVKIIAILRNPVDRAISAYQHGLRIGAIPSGRSLEDSVLNYKMYAGAPFGDIVSNGMYTKQLTPYFELFPRESIMVMAFEDISSPDPVSLQGLGNFLHLGEEYRQIVQRMEIPHANRARKSRSPFVTSLIYKSRFLSYSKKGKLTKRLLIESEGIDVSPRVRELLREIYSDEASSLAKLTGKEFNWD